MSLPWHLYVMATLYILAGLNHFRVPKIYTKIIPPLFPAPKVLNILAGLAEIVLGVLLCFPFATSYAALGIMALLIAIFPANMYMYLNDNVSLGLSKTIRFIRLPLQIVLLYWAYCYV
ncbi:DoxX family membrane protein [Flavobacterium beibuense]|uniref:DoxX family protein n=1 Tax=Flavobacterium beibuense TaxID=657326 RepID=A0A444WID5_9FLAO|nr:DoxX family membrane protein [Flavobacterium beibuense]RYJ45628.1 DoxX family protein [Flavobacterium beibuense]